MAGNSANLTAKQLAKDAAPKDAVQQANTPENKPHKTKRALKRFLIILLIVILLLGGFLLGIYLRVLNTDKLNDSLHLYDWPIIGKSFVKPTGESSGQSGKKEKVDVAGNDNPSGAEPANAQLQSGQQSKPVVLTKKQLEQQKKAREAAINSKIGKVAHIYEQMDPVKAANILNTLSSNVKASVLQKMDPARSAKILENMDSNQAAQITQDIYNGVAPPTGTQIDSAVNAAQQ